MSRPSTTSRARSCSSRSACCGPRCGSSHAASRRSPFRATTSPTTSTTSRSSSCARRRTRSAPSTTCASTAAGASPKAAGGRQRCSAASTAGNGTWTARPSASLIARTGRAVRTWATGLSLHEIKVDTWAGFVFVNFDPACEPLARHLAPVPEYTDCYEFEKMRYRWYKSVRLPCNWKVALEAFSEGYHVFGTHPQLLDCQGDDVTRSFTFGKHGMFGYPAPARPPGAPSPRTGKPGAGRRASRHRQVLRRPGEPAQGDHHPARPGGRQAHPHRVPGRHAAPRALHEGGPIPGARPRSPKAPAGRTSRASSSTRRGPTGTCSRTDLPDVARRHALLPRPARRRQSRLLLLRHLLDRPLTRPAPSRSCKREFYWGKDDWKTNTVEHFGLILSQDFANMAEVQKGMKSAGLPGRAHQPAAGVRDLQFPSRLREILFDEPSGA